VSLALEPGSRVGIVGPNGIGKSTLLDILVGRTAPDAGDVTWGQTVQVGYFDQRNVELDDGQRVVDYIKDEAPLVTTPDGTRVSAEKMLEWFLFDGKEQHTLIGSLSGGERRRLYLLRTLVHQPNVLLLDEPTNDLDVQTLHVLEEFLDHFVGSLIVVSHDRYFLDRNVDELAAFDGGTLRTGYPTPFSTYQRIRAEQLAAAARDGSGAPTTGRPRDADRGNGRRKRADGAKQKGLTYKQRRRLEELEARSEELKAKREELTGAIAASGSDYGRLLQHTNELAAVEAEEKLVLEEWMALAELKDAVG
jgi:ATP-binding cassette subfamily F protein uup